MTQLDYMEKQDSRHLKIKTLERYRYEHPFKSILTYFRPFANIKEEHPVEFFQMEVDKTRFGKLKAVKMEIYES